MQVYNFLNFQESTQNEFRHWLGSRSVNKLNIGSGPDWPEPNEDWINLDAYSFQNVHIVTNLEQGLSMFPDESIDEILSNHALEHLSWKHTVEYLQDWIRVLKVGGKITIRVPDLGKLCLLYVQGRWVIGSEEAEHNIINCIFGNEDDFDLEEHGADKKIVQEYTKACGFHKAGFDKSLMEKYLRQCGCHDVKVTDSDRGHEFEMAAFGTKGNFS